jgi:hypothetical protein
MRAINNDLCGLDAPDESTGKRNEEYRTRLA